MKRTLRILASLTPASRITKYPGALALACLIGLFLGACTKEEKPVTAAPQYKKQLEAAQKRLKEIDLEIVTSQGDMETTTQLTEDKALLLSRIARLKQNLKFLGEPQEGEGAPAGGH